MHFTGRPAKGALSAFFGAASGVDGSALIAPFLWFNTNAAILKIRKTDVDEVERAAR